MFSRGICSTIIRYGYYLFDYCPGDDTVIDDSA